MKRRNQLTLTLLLPVLISCAAPADQDEQSSGAEDLAELQYMEAVGIVLDQCDEGNVEATTASFIKVDSNWHFRPCEECDTRSIELTWGGNTAQHEPLAQELDDISVDLGDQEVSLLSLTTLGSGTPGTSICGP